MHGLNGMKSSVYFSCCTVIKKYGAHASTARAGDKMHNTTHTFAFLTEIHESIERAAMADGCHSPPVQKKCCDLDWGLCVAGAGTYAHRGH